MSDKIDLKACVYVHGFKKTFDVLKIDFVSEQILFLEDEENSKTTTVFFDDVYLCTCRRDSLCQRRH